MPPLARIELERLLHARKLGSTVSAADDRGPANDTHRAPVGLEGLDDRLRGGWPRGHVSELAGELSTGASWIAGVSLASATRRGELAALVDPLDMFDPESAAGAGFVWPYFLWVRGAAAEVPRSTSLVRSWEPIINRAMKALALILQAQGFGLVVLDLQGVPPAVVKRLPFTTWRRVQRMVEGRETVCLVIHGEPMARSAGGVTVTLAPPAGGRTRWSNVRSPARRLVGLSARAHIIRAQWQGSLEDFESNTAWPVQERL
jgi:hypothetical protein